VRWRGCVRGWRTARSAGHSKVLLRRARSVKRSAVLLQALQSSLSKPGGLIEERMHVRCLTGKEVCWVPGLLNKMLVNSERWQCALMCRFTREVKPGKLKEL